MKKKMCFLLCLAITLAHLSACGAATPAKTPDKEKASEQESSSEINIEQASESSIAPTPVKTDGEWVECLKSGSYVKQQASDPFGQKLRGIQFDFERMTFSAGPEEQFSSNMIEGPIVIKDDFLYAVWQYGYKLFVFKIVDDHTLVFSAERSHPLLSNGKAVEDGTVYIWQEEMQN